MLIADSGLFNKSIFPGIAVIFIVIIFPFFKLRPADDLIGQGEA
jgi:hypothetical protein